MLVEKEVEVEEEENEEEDDDEGNEPTVEEVDDEKKVEKKTRKVLGTYWRREPLWLQTPKDVTEEQYEGFYKSLTNDWEGCMKVKHFSEGTVEYTALLYVPTRLPYDMFNNNRIRKHQVVC